MFQILRLITFFLIYEGTVSINPLINGLLDHDARLLIFESVITPIQEFTSCCVTNINSFTTEEFQSKLITESWEDIFEGSDTNVIFNNFFNIHLKIVCACFTKRKLNSSHRYNPWIIREIKLSCHNKRIMCMSCSESNDTNLKLRYKR